jgi:asparagine synthase (glutamine-hydrolysing)
LRGPSGAVLFDGRLDDRSGLCEQLGVRPEDCVPDSRLVALAFEKWDSEAPTKLLGDFALAVWDGRDRRLTLVADPRGTRPLYYYRSGSLLVFSTVLPALLSLPGVPRELDEEVMPIFFLTITAIPGGLFSGISAESCRLPP